MSTSIEGFPVYCMVLLCRISLRERIFGPIGVDPRSRSRSSKGVLESWLVLRAVLSILTCYSIKSLDEGKWGRKWCGLSIDIGETAQNLLTQMEGHCRCRFCGGSILGDEVL